ncbi:MAG TPA: hypothetical protein VF068_09465 [Rubrobacter sp.]
MTRIIDVTDLAHSETSYEFQGHDHDAGVSFIVKWLPPVSQVREHPAEAFTASAWHVVLRVRHVGA